MTEPTVTLKPCPFCGSSNLEVQAEEYVHCNECLADGPYFADGGDRTAEAIAAWNHRTASAPAGEVVAYKITDADGGYWFTDKPENPDLFDCEITQVPLYAHPPAPADLVELVGAARAVIDNTYVGKHGQTVSERSKYGNYEARYYHRLRAALAKHGGA